MQGGVRVYDTDDGDVGKVQPFGDHLGAEQDVYLAAPDALEDAVMRPFAAGRIEVHAREPRGGEPELEEVLELLGADAAHPLGFVPARAARGRDRLLVAAVMAAQRRRRAVDRERDRAAWALAHVAAARALEEGGEAAPVEQQDHLLAALQRAAHRAVQP